MPSVLKERKKEIVLGILMVAIAAALWHNLGGKEAADPGRAARSVAVARVKLDDIKLPTVNWAVLQAPQIGRASCRERVYVLV